MVLPGHGAVARIGQRCRTDRSSPWGFSVRTIRLAALGTVLALLAALFSAASATAASPGIGTSVVGTTIAQLDLGDILSTRILGDDSIATIDKGVLAVPEAAT